MANMRNARIVVVVIGVLLPFVARLPGGLDWLGQYLQGGVGLLLFVSGFNAIAWGAILACSLAYRRPVSLMLPAVFGFAYLAWRHYEVDLRADAQASLALVFLPIYALLPIAIGGALGYLLDRFLRRAVAT
ncbi:MAG TPA: hypothetical protein VN624_02590 [Rhodanobacter sp.]|nr:hypothetical protein [Rhodanobacter sp.]